MIKVDERSNAQSWELEITCKNKKYLDAVVGELLKIGKINFQVQNIESYAIPGLDKNQISPTKWQKFMKTLKNGGKYGIAIGIGVAGGFLIAN